MPKPATDRTEAVFYRMRHLTQELQVAFFEWQLKQQVWSIGPASTGPGFVVMLFRRDNAAAVDGWLRANKVRVVKR